MYYVFIWNIFNAAHTGRRFQKHNISSLTEQYLSALNNSSELRITVFKTLITCLQEYGPVLTLMWTYMQNDKISLRTEIKKAIIILLSRREMTLYNLTAKAIFLPVGSRSCLYMNWFYYMNYNFICMSCTNLIIVQL